MSDLPGEITKQILSAPPRISRSMRYSETAQGRSIPLSLRLPTGSSSLEKARGWMRLPRPAAGTMPHISHSLNSRLTGSGVGRLLEQRDQLGGAFLRTVLIQRSLARASGDLRQFRLLQLQCFKRVRGVACEQDLLARREEILKSRPAVAEQRRAACRRFEQSSGRTPSHLGHGAPRNVQGQPRGSEKCRMLGWRQVAHKIDVRCPGKFGWILGACDQEAQVRR